ncbi:MAG: hypothetical protein Fur005_36230 [Roseiflexaceae bacterium]
MSSSAARRAALAALGVALCIALIAASPRAASPPATVAVEAAPLPTAIPLPPTQVYPMPERYALSDGMNLRSITLDGQTSPEEALALELVPTPAVPTPAPKPRPKLLTIPGFGPSMRGKLIIQTQRLDVYVGSNTFDPADIASVAWKLESLLIENEAGLRPTKLDHRISIGFYSRASAPSRGTRGIAYTDAGRIEIFYAPNENMSAAFTVAAHELAHHLQYQRYGESVHSRSDMILLEGMATWISGVRWLKEYGVPSWRGRANQLYNQGIPLQIVGAQRYGSDNAYELWASFVSYIYRKYGMDVVDQLYISSRGRAVGTADYKGVTGKTLQELTKDWQEWVKAYEPPPDPTPTPVPQPTATPAPRPGR